MANPKRKQNPKGKAAARRRGGGPVPKAERRAIMAAMPEGGCEPLWPAGEGWPEEVRGFWDAFWASPVAGLVGPADGAAFMGYWSDAADAFRLRAELDGLPMVGDGVGDAAQFMWLRSGALAAHPLWSTIARIERRMRGAEDKFGMNPHSRARMGLLDRSMAGPEEDAEIHDLRMVRPETPEQKAAWDAVSG